MVQKTPTEKPVEANNEQAVAWARQMMARKRAEQKRMVEEYKNNPEAQALVAELFRCNKSQRIDDKL